MKQYFNDSYYQREYAIIITSTLEGGGVHAEDGNQALALELLTEARAMAQGTGDKLAFAEVLSRTGEVIGGKVLTGADAELLVVGATGAPLQPSMLVPATPLEVVQRILNNIRAWAAARPERSDVALWAVELALLLPSHPARLRYERAQLFVQRGDFVQGASELEAYAEVVGTVDEPAAARVRQQAHAARAMLN